VEPGKGLAGDTHHFAHANGGYHDPAGGSADALEIQVEALARRGQIGAPLLEDHFALGQHVGRGGACASQCEVVYPDGFQAYQAVSPDVLLG